MIQPAIILLTVAAAGAFVHLYFGVVASTAGFSSSGLDSMSFFYYHSNKSEDGLIEIYSVPT